MLMYEDRVETYSDGMIGGLDPELASDYFVSSCAEFVPAVEGIAILQHRPDIKHPKESLAFLAPVV